MNKLQKIINKPRVEPKKVINKNKKNEEKIKTERKPPVWERIDFSSLDFKKIGIIAGIIILLIVVIFTVSRLTKDNRTYINTDPIEVEMTDSYPMDIELRSEYLKNKKINPDYVGKLSFDSGLITKEFVQADDLYDSEGKFYTFYDEWGNVIKESDKDFACNDAPCTGNDIYIWQNWQTGEYDRLDLGGSVFMDARNTLNDENIIIYGHHFSTWNDENRNKAFTPLEYLIDEKNYENNKYITLVLDNEIRKYQVAYVFEYNIYEGKDYEYYRTSYNYDLTGMSTPGYKTQYFKNIKEKAYYDTGVVLEENDKTLTLQTCYSSRPNYREIVVCKEISRELYSD